MEVNKMGHDFMLLKKEDGTYVLDEGWMGVPTSEDYIDCIYISEEEYEKMKEFNQEELKKFFEEE